MFGQEEAIAKLLQLKKGDIYSGEKMTQSTKKISEHLGTFGYAFANVNPNVFFSTVIVIAIFMGLVLLTPDAFDLITQRLNTWITTSFSWF